MTKAEIKAMSKEQLLWKFAVLATGSPKPTKRELKEEDDLIKEMAARGMISYDDMIAEGKRIYLL